MNDHTFGRCINCGMVQASPNGQTLAVDYSDYGDYLLLSETEIRRRVRLVRREMDPLFRFLKGQNTCLLDFGSGAGYFCKAAEDFGLNAFGVERSDKLIEFSRNKVKFTRVFKSIEEIGQTFDAVFMSDVIEHLDPSESRQTMTNIVNHLNPQGLLIGNTPNVASLNILLCEDNDPVVAPPSHLCYFSLKTLHRYLSGFGLDRVRLFSRGLSSNSFFRRSKFERSFLEKSLRQAKFYQLPLLLSLRTASAVAGFFLQPLGLGYQIYFTYQKT